MNLKNGRYLLQVTTSSKELLNVFDGIRTGFIEIPLLLVNGDVSFLLNIGPLSKYICDVDRSFAPSRMIIKTLTLSHLG